MDGTNREVPDINLRTLQRESHYFGSMLRICLFIACSALPVLGAMGQQALVPAGGESSGTGGTVSWTVGQVDYEATLTAGGSVQRGVQQAYEWLVTSAPDAQMPAVSVWPNPAVDAVQVSWEAPLPGPAHYALYSASGALVQQGAVAGTTVTVPLAAQASGTYVLVITAQGGPYNRITLQKR